MARKTPTLLVIFTLLGIALNTAYALPDLTLTGSDITFSIENPEPTQITTVTATIHNNGSDYYILQIDSEPFEAHDSPDPLRDGGGGYPIYENDWIAEYFVPSENIYLNKASLEIFNYGTMTDSMTVEIRNDTGYLLPGTGASNLVAITTFTCSITGTYHWQEFNFSSPPFLLKGSTYWICAENYATTNANGYVAHVDTAAIAGTMTNRVARNTSRGVNPWTNFTQKKYSAYFKVYKALNAAVSFYNGNPYDGGIFISSVALSNTVPGGGTSIVSSTWSTLVEGSHDIYVAIDYPSPGIITEEIENNNTSYKTINVIPVPPEILSVFPPPDSKGIDINSSITITFNKDMDKIETENSFFMSSVVDNINNEEVSSTGPVSGGPNYSNRILTFTPSPLENGYTYQVWISTQAKDLFLRPISQEKTWRFTAVLDSSGTYIFAADGAKAETKPGIIKDADLYFIEIDTNPAVDTSAADTKIQGTRNSFSYPLNDTLCRFTFKKGSWPGTEFTGNFSEPATITVPYSGATDGTITLGNSSKVKEGTLSIYYLNEENNLWVKIPGSSVNTAEHTVSAEVNHFSVYAIMGESVTDLSKAYAYPVPWRPSDANDITFTELGSEAVIRIYNVSGNLVRLINYDYSTDGAQLKWNVTNDRGDPVASGLYIYYIENDIEHTSGKLVIIR